MDIYQHYVYAYLRSSDNTPYYIGKGKNLRYKERHSVSVPKDNSKIVFLETNLSDIGACALERRYIRWYGRKDLGTGILQNMSDGGQGTSGVKKSVSDETKRKISLANKGRIQSPEERANRSLSLKGMKPSAESNAKRGAKARGRVLGPQSEERKAKTSLLIKQWWAQRKALELVRKIPK
jgi:hypothetical protein